jgi:hypothetical protein
MVNSLVEPEPLRGRINMVEVESEPDSNGYAVSAAIPNFNTYR